MKVLVIGSTSFSGRSFIKYLIKNYPEIEVYGTYRNSLLHSPFDPILNFSSSYYEFRAELNTNTKEIAEFTKKNRITHVINFAAMSMVSESWASPEEWYRTNIESLSLLIQELIRQNCEIERFIHFTTPEVYGSTEGLISENWNFSPSTPYAISRAAGDWHLKILHETVQFPAIFTRAANVFGEHQRLYRIIPKAIYSIYQGIKLPLQGGGSSIRSFIHIEDVSSALFALLNRGTIGSSYHISTNDFITINDLVDKICKILGVQLEDATEITQDRAGKDYAYLLSSSKLRSELGWKDSISLELGIERTRKWVVDNMASFSPSDLKFQLKAR